MSATITGYQTTSVSLTSGGSYANPVTIAGTIAAPSYSGVYVETPWTLDITGTVSSGNFFGIFGQVSATITNYGDIHARIFGAIDLAAGGVINNMAGGTIAGGLQAIYSYYKASTDISNAGYIHGGYTGVKTGYGSVDNTGTIIGGTAGVDLTQAIAITNSGTILTEDNAGIGIELTKGGSLHNTGIIIAYTGVALHGGTLTNAGVIEGETLGATTGIDAPSAYATAVTFTAPGTFIEQTGGAVVGSITGDGGTLILQGGALYQVSGFAQDEFAAIAGANLSASLSGLGTISGFSGTDALIITGADATGLTFSGHALTLTGSTGELGTIAFAGSYAPQAFEAEPDGPTTTEIALAPEIPCFLAGTRIATPAGAKPVEDLAIGDLVLTLHAGPQPIRWIGTRSYAAPFTTGNTAILPIRITAHALAPGRPARDLFVSPGHAIFHAGALIHAAQLVNGTNIHQLTQAEHLAYFHLELATHEIILAENCPAESFLPANFRSQFHNAAEFSRLYPNAGLVFPCLPNLAPGLRLAAIRRRLGVAAIKQAALF